MNKLFKSILIILMIITLFLVNYIPHYNQMPQHVDSWWVISKADFVLDNTKITLIEPFSNTVSYYPLGTHLTLAIISSVTNLNMIYLAQFLPGIFFVILSLLLYSVSKILFKNDLVALIIMAFTPLSFSNITMLGPFYLVPITWGMLLSLLFFYFVIKENYFFSFITFIALVNTHRSSMVFAFIGVGLYFLFNRRYWSKIKYLFLLILIALIFFSITMGYKLLFNIITNLFAFQKSTPYVFTYSIIPVVFIILLALGFYFILVKEKEASKFLIPLFSVLAINVFLYMYWQGFFLVYRKLFTFSFMMLPFFVGYAVYNISDIAKKIINKKMSFIKKCHLILLLLLILVPLAIKANVDAHKETYIYVTNEEHIFFTKFGNLYPNTYLATDHLQAFALPYYNLKPIQLSPGHGVNTTYFPKLAPCYANKNPKCFGDFFNETNFSYFYSKFSVDIIYFKPFFSYENKIIYEFDIENFNKTNN